MTMMKIFKKIREWIVGKIIKSQILFDDRELEKFEGEEGKPLISIVNEETQKKIDKEIEKILDNICVQL